MIHVRDAYDLNSTVVAANKIPEGLYRFPFVLPKCHTVGHKSSVQVDYVLMFLELDIGQIFAKPFRIITSNLGKVSAAQQTDRKGRLTSSKALITIMAYGSTGWFSDVCITLSAHSIIRTIIVSIVL